MKKIKLARYVLFLSFFVLGLFEISTKAVCAANSEVIITVKESKTANLYYQIVKDGEKITDEVVYAVRDETGNTVYKGTTEDAIFFVGEVPLGKYVLIIHENRDYIYEINVNKEYLKKHHLLKIIELKECSIAQTGDVEGNKIVIDMILVVGMMLFFFCKLKRRRKRCE